jgi:hypothetical protein
MESVVGLIPNRYNDIWLLPSLYSIPLPYEEQYGGRVNSRIDSPEQQTVPQFQISGIVSEKYDQFKG